MVRTVEELQGGTISNRCTKFAGAMVLFALLPLLTSIR